MKLFVTVGTTSFDKLIQTLDTTVIQEILANRGFNDVVMQIGRGVYEPDTKHPQVSVEYYRYKDSLVTDIECADFAISHAGAGSCLEILGAGKPLVVVVNEDLMNNHQIELAAKLSEEGHLYYCNCRILDSFEKLYTLVLPRHVPHILFNHTLAETLKTMDLNSLRPFPQGQPDKFATIMNNVFAVS